MRPKIAPTKKQAFKTRLEAGKLYAAFDETAGCYVYVGGRYYGDTAQIHLSREEAIALRIWLNKHVRGRK